MKNRTTLILGMLCSGVLVLGGCTDLRLPNPDAVFIAFGDSATNGPSDRNYHEFLAEMLGEPRTSIANEGMGGETSSEGVSRLRSLPEGELYPNATVLLYWEGGVNITRFIRENDSFLLRNPMDDDYPFAASLNSMLDRLQIDLESGVVAGQEKQLTVYLATYFSLYDGLIECDTLPLNLQFPGQAPNGQAYIDLLNERIRAAARNTGAILVDVAANDRIAADKDHYEDCNHMSEEGNELVAETFLDVVSNQPSP